MSVYTMIAISIWTINCLLIPEEEFTVPTALVFLVASILWPVYLLFLAYQCFFRGARP
jgi:hypothetical protein